LPLSPRPISDAEAGTGKEAEAEEDRMDENGCVEKVISLTLLE
jgi:hypothetical protein